MLQPILLIIFDIPKVYYARIYHFKKCFNQRIFCYGPIYVQWHQEINLISNFSTGLRFFDVLDNFACHIRLPQGFYIGIYYFQKCFNWEIFCYRPIYVLWHQEVTDTLQIFGKDWCLQMLQTILLIIFDFPKVFCTGIYYFQKYFNQEIFCYGPIYILQLVEVTHPSNFST